MADHAKKARSKANSHRSNRKSVQGFLRTAPKPRPKAALKRKV